MSRFALVRAPDGPRNPPSMAEATGGFLTSAQRAALDAALSAKQEAGARNACARVSPAGDLRRRRRRRCAGIPYAAPCCKPHAHTPGACSGWSSNHPCGRAARQRPLRRAVLTSCAALPWPADLTPVLISSQCSFLKAPSYPQPQAPRPSFAAARAPARTAPMCRRQRQPALPHSHTTQCRQSQNEHALNHLQY